MTDRAGPPGYGEVELTVAPDGETGWYKGRSRARPFTRVASACPAT